MADISTLTFAGNGTVPLYTAVDFTRFGGVYNTAAGGRNGDIRLSTGGFDANSTYDLTVELVKKS